MANSQPPPRSVDDFDRSWKDWLWFHYVYVDELRTFSNVTSVSAAYTVKATDEIILADSTGGSFSVTLQTGANNRILTVKNIAAANTVTIDGYAAETIDGAATKDLTTLQSATIVYSSAESGWFII